MIEVIIGIDENGRVCWREGFLLEGTQAQMETARHIGYLLDELGREQEEAAVGQAILSVEALADWERGPLLHQLRQERKGQASASACQHCGSPVQGEFCTNQTCPYSIMRWEDGPAMDQHAAQEMAEAIEPQLPKGWKLTRIRLLGLFLEAPWGVELKHRKRASVFLVRNQADWERFNAAGGNLC